MVVNHNLMISWGLKVRTLPPCWDLLTWVGLGTPCEPAAKEFWLALPVLYCSITCTSKWKNDYGSCLPCFLLVNVTKSKKNYAYNNQNLTLMIVNHNLMISWGLKVGTLPPCRDLLTWVGLGTWDPCEPAAKDFWLALGVLYYSVTCTSIVCNSRIDFISTASIPGN